MTNWYAVYTRPRCEKKVAENFTKKKIENYCPQMRVASTWGGKRGNQKPLFSSYVFARLNETQLQEVRKIDGVINLIYWLGKPIVIREIEIEMIKRFLEEHKEVRLEMTNVDPKAIVKITQDTSDEAKAMSENLITVTLLLPSLGRALTADVRTESIKVITNYQPDKRFRLSF